MTEEEKFKFEARLMMARRISQAREAERNRIGDRIELLLFEAKSQEAAEALLSVAHYIFDGGKA